MSRRSALTILLCLAFTLAVSASSGALQAQNKTSFTFSTISVSGAVETDANAIDTAGTIVGFYVDSQGVDHGFSDTAGKITILDVPDSIGTLAYGINEDGDVVVGWFTDSRWASNMDSSTRERSPQSTFPARPGPMHTPRARSFRRRRCARLRHQLSWRKSNFGRWYQR